MVRAAAALALLALLGAGDPPAGVMRRIPADEARQGVASDGTHVYAVDNNRIGKYRIADGRPAGKWEGGPALFPHVNSCAVVGRELACAASNYPAVPQASSVEFFDTRTLRHVRSRSLGIAEGSLTALDRYRGNWWAVFAHYEGRGGEPGKGSAYAQLVKLDDEFRPLARWTFPADVIDRMRPYSASGASWSADGRLAVTGHDKPEVYILALPAAGPVLVLEATIAIATEGQAIDWDPRLPGRLWSISRAERAMVLSDLRPSPPRP